jgi:ATP-dependent DNA ligase
LATETPAIYVTFDLLAAEDGRSLMAWPFSERRRRLEEFAATYFNNGSIRLSPSAPKLAQARKWLAAAGASLDGIVAKRCD